MLSRIASDTNGRVDVSGSVGCGPGNIVKGSGRFFGRMVRWVKNPASSSTRHSARQDASSSRRHLPQPPLRALEERSTKTVCAPSSNVTTNAALGVTAGVSAAAGVAAAVNYAGQDKGMTQDEIKQFLPHPNDLMLNANVFVAHNAFTDNDIMGNQHHSATWLLDNTPTRGFQLDIKRDGNGGFIIQHDLHGAVRPVKLEDALGEINAWLDNHPDQVVFFDLDVTPELRADPDLAEVFSQSLGNKVTKINPPTFGEITGRARQVTSWGGCQVVFMNCESGERPKGWENFQFSNPSWYIVSQNDSLGYFFTRGYPSVDKERRHYGDFDQVNPDAIKRWKVDPDNGPYNPLLINLDQINRHSFLNPKGTESIPTVGPFYSASVPVNASMVGVNAGGMTFSVVGPAAYIAIRMNNILKKLDELSKDPVLLDSQMHKQLVQQTAQVGLGLTAGASSALVTAAITYPAMFDPLGIAAVATAGAGLLGTMLGTGAIHWRLKNIANQKGIYQLWPEKQEPASGNTTSYNTNEANHVSVDRTSADDNIQELVNVLAWASIMTRFTSTTKYFLPVIAPAATGVGLGLAAISSALDAYCHTKKISEFIEHPEKAIEYYRSKSVQRKKMIIWGHSQLTKFLDSELKTSSEFEEKLANISGNIDDLEDGHDVLKLLTLTKEDFLHKELRSFLKKIDDNQIERLWQKIGGTSRTEPLGRTFNCFCGKDQGAKAVDEVIHRIKRMGDDWNNLRGKETKDELNPKEKEELNRLSNSLDKFWAQVNNLFRSSNESPSDFQETFLKKLSDRQELLSETIEAVNHAFSDKALERFAKNSKKVPSWLRTTIIEYAKRPDEAKAGCSLQEAVDEAIENHYSGMSAQQRNVEEEAANRKERLSSIQERAIFWRIKKSMRKDIRLHGLRNSAQLGIGVGAMAIAIPPASGPISTAAGLTCGIGSVVSEIVARRRANLFEKNYLKYINHNNDMQPVPSCVTENMTPKSSMAVFKNIEDGDLGRLETLAANSPTLQNLIHSLGSMYPNGISVCHAKGEVSVQFVAGDEPKLSIYSPSEELFPGLLLEGIAKAVLEHVAYQTKKDARDGKFEVLADHSGSGNERQAVRDTAARMFAETMMDVDFEHLFLLDKMKRELELVSEQNQFFTDVMEHLSSKTGAYFGASETVSEAKKRWMFVNSDKGVGIHGKEYDDLCPSQKYTFRDALKYATSSDEPR